jgi:hypothetical protein
MAPLGGEDDSGGGLVGGGENDRPSRGRCELFGDDAYSVDRDGDYVEASSP